MSEQLADALVLFGATGDLAYQQIFPALHAISRRGRLGIPVICTARQPWSREQLIARARDSISKRETIDHAVFTPLASQLQYIGGDYADPATFAALDTALGSAARPLFYLAIPPGLFGPIAKGIAALGWGRARDWWSRSRSAETSNRRVRSTGCCISSSRNPPSTASITTSARNRC